MKKIFENKFLLIVITLVIGGIVGWIIKPGSSADHEDHTPSTETADGTIWTCSMHPQIRLGEPGDCPICGMDLIEVSKVSSPSSNPLVHTMTPEAVALAQIHTTKIGGVNNSGELFLTGKIQTDERENASVTSKFPGRIEKLFVSFTGEQVKAGQRLATLYSPEILSAQRELLEAAKIKNEFPELYQASKEKLRLWKLTETQISEIEEIGKVKDQIDILADQAGVVIQRNVSVGDYVSTGTVLFNVVNLSKLWVLLDAYESDLSLLNLGNEISFNVAGLQEETFKAKITYIDPILNPSTRTASVRAEVNNSGQKLKPEMFVTARIKTNAKASSEGISVPRTSVLWSGKRSVVYVKDPSSEMPAFEMREVTIGPRMGEMYLIKSGLQVGEEIVTNGVFAIDAAAQLAGNYSMMKRPKTKSIEVSNEFRNQITKLADAYFQVKNALVEDNEQESKKSLIGFNQSLGAVDMKLLNGSGHDLWMEMWNGMKDASSKMEKSTTIEEQRTHFSMLSLQILEMTETFGIDKEVVYKDFCPMAFGNQGAFWLSEEKDILNPYFGTSMISCGEVKDTYRKGQLVIEKAIPDQNPSAAEHKH